MAHAKIALNVLCLPLRTKVRGDGWVVKERGEYYWKMGEPGVSWN